MDKQYSIKNFRVFNEDGASFKLAPLTILTGTNSCGKSSLAKSILLLSQYLNKVKKGIENNCCVPNEYPMEFFEESIKYGQFDLCVNKASQNKKDAEMVFSYEHVSSITRKSLIVEMHFKAQENDSLNNGWLSSLKIYDDKRELVYSGSVSDIYLDSSFDRNNTKIFYPDGEKYKGLKADYICLSSLKECFLSNLHYIYNREDGKPYNLEDLEQRVLCTGLDSLHQHLTYDEASYLKFSTLFVENPEKLERFEQERQLRLNEPAWFHEHEPRYYNRNIDHGIIVYLPIFDLFGVGDFDSVREVMLQYVDSGDSAKMATLDKILNDFKNTEFKDFYEYYRYIENTQGLIFNNPTGGPDECPRGCKSSHDFFNYLLYEMNLDTQVYKIHQDEFSDHVAAPEGKDEFHKSISTKEDYDARTYVHDRWKDIRKEGKITFGELYNFLYDISLKCDNVIEQYFPEIKARLPYESNDSLLSLLKEHSYILSYISFTGFCVDVIKDALMPSLADILTYIGSSRCAVKRVYALDGNQDSFDKLLIKYQECCRCPRNIEFEVGSYINAWIRRFEIGHSFSIDNTKDGLGVVLRIHKDENDINGHLLADEGYGITQLLSILISIEICIIQAEELGGVNPRYLEEYKDELKKSDPNDYFYVEEKYRYYKHYIPQTIIIEEPEIHLHPRFQSLLADLFRGAYANYSIQFIIETHSEYLIRKIQTLVAEGERNKHKGLKPDEVSVYYLYNPEKVPEGKNQVNKLDLREDGRFMAPFGTGFFDEADNLSLALFTDTGK